MNYNGIGAGNTYKAYITMPIKVENFGTFSVSAGWLVVQNGVAATLNNSVYMTGSLSTVKLSQSAVLEADSNYQQDDGALALADTTRCTLMDQPGGAGDAIINGGSVSIQVAAPNGSNPYLDLQSSNIQFNGGLIVVVNGAANQVRSYLRDSTGSITLGKKASLTVEVDNTPTAGNSWTVISCTGTITGDFAGGKSNSGGFPFTYKPNVPVNGQYQVMMPN